MSSPSPFVVVVMPHRGGQGNIGAGMALQGASLRHRFVQSNRGHSLLTFCFNQLWVEALNLRGTHPVTHVAMLHNDVCPNPGWVDILLDEMDATGADMLSAVVPIKDGRGLTSTTVEDAADPWMTRRVTLSEMFALPDTFAAEDLPWWNPQQYGRLLLNTGCWLAKLGPWCDTPGPVTGHRPWFRQQDRVVRRGAELLAQSMPEDWDWSRQLHDLGLKLLATRKVGLYHERQEFDNRHAWGTWKTDLGYLQFKKLEREALSASPVTEPEPSCL